MAGRNGVALISAVAVALCGGACPFPRYRFPVEDLSQGAPPPPSRILCGERVVVRIPGGTFRSMDGFISAHVDVFPAGAVLRGAWVKIRSHAEVCEGAATVSHVGATDYVLSWPPVEGEPACARRANGGPRSATVWLGPICLEGRCETLRVDEPDPGSGGAAPSPPRPPS